MNFLKHFYENTIKHDLVNKFLYLNTKKIPKIKKIILNFGCNTNEIKCLAASLLALELITNQKGILTQTKYSLITLKIRKGSPVGCKVTLRKNIMLNIISNFLIKIFPKLKNFEGLTINYKIKQKTLSYNFNDLFIFSILEEHYYLFNNLPKLNITLVVHNIKTKQELFFLLKSVQLPFKSPQV
jgi:large subunit ribosomal protein L5